MKGESSNPGQGEGVTCRRRHQIRILRLLTRLREGCSRYEPVVDAKSRFMGRFSKKNILLQIFDFFQKIQKSTNWLFHGSNPGLAFRSQTLCQLGQPTLMKYYCLGNPKFLAPDRTLFAHFFTISHRFRHVLHRFSRDFCAVFYLDSSVGSQLFCTFSLSESDLEHVFWTYILGVN